MIALSIGCLAACGVVIAAEWLAMIRLRRLGKLVASAAFVAVGVLALGEVGDAPGQRDFGHAIVAGLVLGAIGDGCVAMPGKRWFIAGLIAFLLGHVAYIAGIAVVEPWQRWLGDAGWSASVPIGVGIAVLARLWPRLGSLRPAVIAYVITITVMLIAAIAAGHGAALPCVSRWRLVAGASAFFVSDLAVARDRFLGHRLANKLWGLPAYYTGQLLLAWSIAGP